MEYTLATIVSITIVIGVIILQLRKFKQNRNRIDLFSQIFAGQDYSLERDQRDMVVGIAGTGNEIFDDIKESINGYLRGTQGTEVDFQLLKDSVDRHCDMIEDEINSQMPLPLYFGLAGTMIGAIIGLFSLVFGGSILELMSGSSDTNAYGAASNINDLLWGVAIAMVASACGIIMTSANTIYFKEKKLQEETEKNKFLAWIQSQVLSAVPSGMSQQMKALVNQLATFNRNFKSNTDEINITLNRAQKVYLSQASVIKEYQAIDLEKIANGANSIMLRLQNSTESLDDFTMYIHKVHEYYEEMQVFAEKLNKETERIKILEDIQKFFKSHEKVISQETSDAHASLRKSLKDIQDKTEKQVNETYTALTEQSQKLKDAVEENNKQFKNLCKEMRAKFQDQMDSIPTIAENFKKLEDIPSKLEEAITRITQSQERLASDFLTASQKITNNIGKGALLHSNSNEYSNSHTEIPASIKWIVIVGISLMTLATVGNTAYNIYKGEVTNVSNVQTTEDGNMTSTEPQFTDSIH